MTRQNKELIEQYLVSTDEEKKNEIEGKLILNHIKMIKSLVKTHCNYQDREEGIQEGRIAVMKAVRSYDINKGSSITTYIHHKITYGLMNMNTAKKQQRMKELPLSELQPQNLAIESTSMEGIIELTDRLNDREKTIVTKKYLEGYSTKELMKELKLGKTQIYKIEKAALKQLKEWLMR